MWSVLRYHFEVYNKPLGKGYRAIASGNGGHRRLAASRQKCNSVKW